MQTTANTTASRAIAAGLGLALTLGMALTPLTPALADQGQITITQQHNAGATYDAYRVFDADIADDGSAAHISWASQGMQSTVLAFLGDEGYAQWLEEHHHPADQRELAQNAAAFVAERIEASPTDDGAATRPRTTQGLSFANRLARALATSGLPCEQATSGQAFEGTEGYWLFCTTDSTTEAYGEAGTAPIWVPLGGQSKTVLEKSASPSIDKQVWEDSGSSWGKVADAHTQQTLRYRLVGTLPQNFGAFDHYHFCFQDSLSDGLDLDVTDGSLADSLTITVGGQPVDAHTAPVTIGYDKRVLSVDFADLKDEKWADYGIGKDTVIVVEYAAHLNAERLLGAAGNPNEAHLVYTDDPISNQDGRCEDVPVKVFAYALVVDKVDEQTGAPLEGARFTLRVAQDNSDEDSRGQYVQADGSLGTEAHVFVTGTDGSFRVEGLDEGSYVLSETEAPTGYEAIDEDVSLLIKSTLEGPALKLAHLTATATGGDTVDLEGSHKTEVGEVDGTVGTVHVTVTNDQLIAMPLTGQGGVGAAGALGAALAAVSGSLWRRRRTSL